MTVCEAEALASFINKHDGRYTAAARSAPGGEAFVLAQRFEPGRGRVVYLYHQLCDYVSGAWGQDQEDEAFQSVLLVWESHPLLSATPLGSARCEGKNETHSIVRSSTGSFCS